MRILFQGDSITDMGRNREDYYDLGNGYVKYACENLKRMYPDIEFEFINKGISGNQLSDLIARMDADLIYIQPDIVSVLIGINDVWSHWQERDYLTDEEFEARYRTVLDAIKEKTNARIMMLEPFLIYFEERQFCREDLDPKIQVVRKLAREYADVYIPTDGLLAAAYNNDDPQTFAEDGVHPTPKCAEIIGKIYADNISKIIDKIKEK